MVGDDVVEVAGDPQPLLRDPAPGLLLAGALGAFGALPDGVHEGPPAADGVPCGGGHAGPGEDAEVLLRVPGGRAEDHGRGGEHRHGGEADPPGGGPVGAGGDRAERDDGAHGDGRGPAVVDQLDEGERHGEAEHDEGLAAAAHQGGGPGGHEQHAVRVGRAVAEGGPVRAAVRVGERPGDHADEHGERERRVEGERMRPEPVDEPPEGERAGGGSGGGHGRQRYGAEAAGPVAGRAPRAPDSAKVPRPWGPGPSRRIGGGGVSRG